jgi:pimeloyl-ACP methyl ester carboxylesterase
VPARLAGIASWVNKRGNHTWVEVWDGGWHFTGAAEPDSRGLDHAWFVADAALAQKGSRRHAIWAVSYRSTGQTFPMVWSRGEDPVWAVDVTDRYAKSSDGTRADDRLRLMVGVSRGGQRVRADVVLTDVDFPRRVYMGRSRDESYDLNDMLTFLVPPGRTWRIEVRDGTTNLELTHPSRGTDQESVVVNLDGVDAPTFAASIGTPARGAAVTTPAGDRDVREALRAFFAAEHDARAVWHFAPELDARLRRDESAVRALAWESFRDSPLQTGLRADFAENRVRAGGYESPYTVKTVGEKPEGGWPLFIAMHGGGGVPKAVNDRGWRTMQGYYRDQPGLGYLYVALRAPTDEWNGFYTDYVYPLIERLIRQFLICGEVDPDRVFLMGYSHGGYGAFAIGPKMPDRFAAVHASAAAPTDGETSAKTLRNLRFTFMIGENDTAYGRIERCRKFAELMSALRESNPDAYPVAMELKEGYGHGGLPDRDKIADLYPHVRNPTPRELTWELTDGVIEDFYWLSVPAPGKGQEIGATCRDNRIELTTEGVRSFAVELDARLVDYDRPVVLVVDGVERECKSRPTLLQLCRSLVRRGDPRLAATCRIDIDLTGDK